MQDVKQVDYTVNSFNKMIQSKMIRKDNRGLMIQLKNIHDKTREDGSCWNRRDMTTPAVEANIESICKHIEKGGQIPAIEVQPREGGGVVKIDGYCRTEALKRLDASSEGDLWVYIVPFDGDERDALRRIWSSNKDLKLTPLDQLDLYVSMREELRAAGEKGTLQQIADEYDVSKQYVDQILKLADLTPESRELLRDGKITTKQAIAAIRKGGEKQTENLQAQAKANADKDKPKPPTVSKELFVDMYGHVQQIRGAMPKETAVAVGEFLNGNRAATDTVQIPVGELAKLMALLGEGDRQIEAKASKAKAKDEASRQEEMADDDLKQDGGAFTTITTGEEVAKGGGDDDEPDLGGEPEKTDEPDLSFL